jgi:mono/diheme cytochrome c family protein
MQKLILGGLATSTLVLALGQSFVGAQAVSRQETGAAGPTFNRDIAPIFYKNCVACHQPESMAPMSLLDYKSARPYAASIRRAVENRVMPPWFADPQYGHFSNEMRLSDRDIETIKAWVDSGSTEGDAKDLPARPIITAGFKLGPPDIIIDIGQDYAVPPGDDVRKTFVVPTNFTEGKWIRAAEVLPGNPKLVHHVHLSVIAGDAKAGPVDEEGNSLGGRSPALWDVVRGQALLKDSAPVVNDACGANLPALPNMGMIATEGGSFSTMLPGKGPDVFDIFGDGSTAKWIPAGAKLSFSMHYANVREALPPDRTMVGLYLAKTAPVQPVKRMDARDYYFMLPPGADNQEVRKCVEYSTDKVILSITPHMHYRGKDARYELLHPDGRRETLLYVPHYNFNWQQIYRFKEPVPVQKGSKLIITFHYDNSRSNRANPDPDRLVRWGDRSEDEMMTTWTDVIDALPPNHAPKTN